VTKLKPKSSVKSTKLFPHQYAQLSLTWTAAAPCHARLSDLLRLLSTTVVHSLLLKLITNRFPTNFTRLMLLAPVTKAQLQIRYIIKSMLVPTPLLLKEALQLRSSTTNSLVTADRVARRPTRAPTKNRESLWQTIVSLLLLTPACVLLQSAHQLYLIADLH
jgi:hypothetical protein